MTRTRQVAVVQHSPAVLDVAEGLRRARRLVGQAAAEGAQLVAFPEAWLGGYPAWMFAMAGWDDPQGRDWYARFLQESLVVGDERFTELRQIAVDHGVTLVMGLNERAGAEAGSVYNSIATIGPDGALLNLHRKLTPTHTERIAWAAGDARGLRVVATPVGRVGGLVCWEHWHPLARQALHAQEEQIHVAVWPDQPEMHVLASRTYAFEGRCFVVSAATYLRLADVPEGLREAYDRGIGPLVDDPELCLDGGSSVIGPDGTFVVEPVRGEAIIHATIDLDERDRRSSDLDVTGHYGRSDVFRLEVDDRPRDIVHRRSGAAD